MNAWYYNQIPGNEEDVLLITDLDQFGDAWAVWYGDMFLMHNVGIPVVFSLSTYHKFNLPYRYLRTLYLIIPRVRIGFGTLGREFDITVYTYNLCSP